jgi:hypothetical protein
MALQDLTGHTGTVGSDKCGAPIGTAAGLNQRSFSHSANHRFGGADLSRRCLGTARHVHIWEKLRQWGLCGPCDSECELVKSDPAESICFESVFSQTALVWRFRSACDDSRSDRLGFTPRSRFRNRQTATDCEDSRRTASGVCRGRESKIVVDHSHTALRCRAFVDSPYTLSARHSHSRVASSLAHTRLCTHYCRRNSGV